MRNPKEWKGCFTAIVTPFKEDGQLDRDAFCKNIELLIEEGGDGIIIAGCTGESWALSEEEKKEIFNLGVKQANGRTTVIGGTGQITPGETIRLCNYAKEAGMDGVMILPPGQVIPSQEDVFAFFETIANAVDIPILLYNNPKRQAVDISPELVLKLAEIENVVAIKESSKEFSRVLEIIRIAGDKIRVFTGKSSVRGVPAVLMGAVGWVGSADTQVMGKVAVEMFSLAERGEVKKAREIQYQCIALEEGLGKIRAGADHAQLKYAMNLRNRPGGFARKPIQPLTESEKQSVATLLQSLNLI